MTIRCPSCGARSEDSARFCPACGRPRDPSAGDPAGEALTFEPAATPVAAISATPRVPSTREAASVGAVHGPAHTTGHGRFEPGTVLAGRYRVVALLGRGGMGEVYRADDLTLGQPVALKFLPPDVGNDLDRLTRFRSEVSTARQVSHPNVCRVYDIGEVDGLTFLSMEYIDGEDLASLLRRIGRLPQDKGLEIARQVCAGLAAAHDRGVIHRDLKPANVMIDGRGHARIADFGLAAAHDAAVGAAALAGTPAYMAPEQFEGRPATVQSDVYALGLVLYEIFTGKRAFAGSTVHEFAQLHRDGTPSSMTAIVNELDPAIERAIERCLAKDPADRPASALTVAASLPGGDPLAAAIARGETPAPEVVAAAGSVGLVKPAWALAGFGLVVAALAALVVFGGYLDPVRVVPMPDSPDVLRHRAQQIVRALGYRDQPVGVSSGFMASTERVRETMRLRWRARLEQMRAAEPPLIYFWYRQSSEPLEPIGRGTSRVEGDNPPETRPGMISVRIDPSRGRLYRFVAVPVDGPGAAQAAVIDWTAILQQAGFDPSRLTAANPVGVPPVYADARAAWDATSFAMSGSRVHVEAAALHGRLVYFDVSERRAPEAAATGAAPPARISWVQSVFMPLLLLGLMVASLLLALRNLRLSRTDRRGAFRIAAFLFALTFAGVILGADLYARVLILFNIVVSAMMLALVSAALAWIAYAALEPYVRRRLPHALISWSRLLSGRWRDPLVARDILMGVLLGLMLDVWLTAAEFVARGSLNSGFSQVWPLDGFRFALTAILEHATRSVLGGLGIFVLLFALTVVVRRQAIAAVLLVLILTAQGGIVQSGDPLVGAAGVIIGWTSVMLALRRFGLLMLVTAVFVGNVAGGLPVTFDVSSWFAPSAYMVIALVVGLALFGAWTSANLGKLVPRMLGEETE